MLQPDSDLSLGEVCRAESKANLLKNMETVVSETFRQREEYTINWMVKIFEGREKADEIAERYGFINNGQVSSFILHAYSYWLLLSLCNRHVSRYIIITTISYQARDYNTAKGDDTELPPRSG